MAHVDDWLTRKGEWLREFRRDVHAHPELSWQERRTTELVFEALTAAGLHPRRLSTTGLVCDLGPSEGPRIALRADMDALPIHEDTGLPFASTSAGVSHACGHDLHTSILLGTGLALATVPELPIGVRLVFQPAEEVMPGGALSAVRDGVLDGVSKIFALHCDPRIEVGKVGVRSGPITSAADHLEVVLHSAGGHTSRPHLTSDLIYGLGTVIVGLPGVLSRRIDPRSGTVMVWGAANGGSAPNAIPQIGRLNGTVRTGEHHVWEILEPLVREAVDGMLGPLRLKYEVNYTRGVPPVINDEAATATIAAAARAFDPEGVTDTPQSGGGEDFSWYLEDVPGAMARLGVWPGEGPQHDIHQPDFIADERALETGVRILYGIVFESGSELG
ncbi:amidohydrolase [Tsukamurella sp. 8F]|uniref:amidohydrolase n=1 Tax=unclassified Tsukamurella TaxID=2633480 RepID=UPI0023B9A0A0|nr:MULTISPECIES: amidohydrolase [unclassified Tsukamurella]MDF0528974.1 amidohydrolase [Tsukamurella sp. 8J]MDF0587347.1 amidohydrolase [Tsukamurella sp. 8F]